MARLLLIAGLCFTCGILVGKFALQASLPSASIEKTQEAKADTSTATAPCSAHSAQSTPKPSGASEITLSNQFSKSANIVVTQPRSVPVQVLDTDTEAKTLDLISSPLPPVANVSQKQSPDGAVEIHGKSDDGRSFFRHFNPKGELTKEGWDDSRTGENVYRSYYETGELKFISWLRADKSLTTIDFTQSGYRESRFDRLANGTTYATDYDDAGEVKSIWQTTKDGAKHQLFPEK